MARQNRKYHALSKEGRLEICQRQIGDFEGKIFQHELNIDRYEDLLGTVADDEEHAEERDALKAQIQQTRAQIRSAERAIEVTVRERDKISPPEKKAREQVRGTSRSNGRAPKAAKPKGEKPSKPRKPRGSRAAAANGQGRG